MRPTDSLRQVFCLKLKGCSCLLQPVPTGSSYSLRELKKVTLALWPQTENSNLSPLLNLYPHTGCNLDAQSYKLSAFLLVLVIQAFYCLSGGREFRLQSSPKQRGELLTPESNGKHLGYCASLSFRPAEALKTTACFRIHMMDSCTCDLLLGLHCWAGHNRHTG